MSIRSTVGKTNKYKKCDNCDALQLEGVVAGTDVLLFNYDAHTKVKANEFDRAADARSAKAKNRGRKYKSKPQCFLT